MSIFVCNQCGGPLIKKGRPKGIQQYYCKVCQVKTLHPREIEEDSELEPESAEPVTETPQEEIIPEEIAQEEVTQEVKQEEPVQVPAPTISDAMTAVQQIAQRLLQQGEQVNEIIKQKEANATVSNLDAEKKLKPSEQTGGIHQDGIYYSCGIRISGIDWHYCRMWSLLQSGIDEDSDIFKKEQQDYNAVINMVRPNIKHDEYIIKAPEIKTTLVDRILRR